MQTQKSIEGLRTLGRFLHRNTEHGVIAKVEEGEDFYAVTTTGGTGFAGIKKPAKLVPQAGQKITFYFHNGWRVQGIDLDGKELFFKLPEELEEERRQALILLEAEMALRKQKFDAELADPHSKFNLRLARLPKVFRQRFQKFFRLGKDFWDHAWYELVSCETALKIASACGSWQKIRKFRAMNSEEQRALIPTMDDGLSGNMFGFACMLARFYLRDSKLVLRMHGAMSPLVGSKPYIGK